MESTNKKLESLPGHKRVRHDAPTVEIPAETIAECARRWREYQEGGSK